MRLRNPKWFPACAYIGLIALTNHAIGTWNEGDIAKQHNFVQGSNSTPIEDNSSPFSFVADIRNTVSNQTGTVTLPAATQYPSNPITVVDPALLVGAHYIYQVPYSSLGALNAVFPDGTYTFNISRTYSSGSTTTFSQSVNPTNALGMPSAVPQITNGTWSDGKLLIDPTNPVITWNQWTNPGSSASRVEIELYTQGGAGGATMSANGTSLNWQGVKPNTTYQATLSFVNVEDSQTFVDQNASDQDLGFRALYATQTKFTIQVLPDPRWTQLGTHPGSTLLSIASADSKSVAVGQNGLTATLSNTTGTWTTTNSSSGRTLNNVIFGNGKYVSVGASGTIRTSTDGLTWTDRTSNTTNDLQAVVWSGNKYLAAGSNGTIVTSTDAVTWTSRNSNASWMSFKALAYSGSLYVTASDNGVLISNDAVSWRQPTNSGGAAGQTVTWTGMQFLLGQGSFGSGALYKSADGNTWIRDYSWSKNITRLLTAGGITYVCGTASFPNRGYFQQTTDGVNWTTLTPVGSSAFRDITWNGQYVEALDSNNNVLAATGIPYQLIQFTAASYSVSENSGSIDVSVTRLGTTTSSASVNYATVAGTATANADYSPVNGTLSFATGEISKTVTIPILNDSLIEENETFTINVSVPTGGAALGNPATTTVTIIDDDPRPVMQFAVASYNVAENAGYVQLTVTRTWDTASPASVGFTTVSGSASAGTDFIAQSGILDFSPNETSKTIQVNIVDNSSFDWPRSFSVRLSNPSLGSSLGTISTATVNISNDDPAPVGLVILEANYGANGTVRDVKSYVTNNISADTVNMVASNSTLGGDPISGVVKNLYVRFQNAAGHFQMNVGEGGTLRIPNSTQQRLPMPFSQWASIKFSSTELNDSTISGVGADPDGDGIPNLLEYALNLDPKFPARAGLPLASVTLSGSDRFLTLSYTPNPDAQSIAYVVEVSGNLQDWNFGAAYTQQISASGATTFVFQDLTPISDSGSRFIRLNVIQN